MAKHGSVAMAAIALLLGASALVGFAANRPHREEHGRLGRGVHFVTIVVRPDGRCSPFGPQQAETVEEWISFDPLKWRAAITPLQVHSALPFPEPPPLRRVFVFDGREVMLILGPTREAYIIDASLTAIVRRAERPVIPEDFLFLEARVAPAARGRLVLNGDIFASVIIERDMAIPDSMFEVPADYRQGGVIRTTQDLIDAGSGPSVVMGDEKVPLPSVHQLEDAANKAPNDPYTHYILGIAVWRADDDRAERELRRAAELWSSSPESAYAHNALSALYELRGDIGKAIAELEASVTLKPAEALTWENLSRLYEKAGEAAKASAARNEALALQSGR